MCSIFLLGQEIEVQNQITLFFIIESLIMTYKTMKHLKEEQIIFAQNFFVKVCEVACKQQESGGRV